MVQSRFDLLIVAKYDPKPSFEAFPKAFRENFYFAPQKINALSKVYIQCTESSFVSVTKSSFVSVTKSSFVSVTNMDKQKISEEENWQFFELPTSHILQATMSEKLIDLLLDFGKRI